MINEIDVARSIALALYVPGQTGAYLVGSHVYYTHLNGQKFHIRVSVAEELQRGDSDG